MQTLNVCVEVKWASMRRLAWLFLSVTTYREFCGRKRYRKHIISGMTVCLTCNKLSNHSKQCYCECFQIWSNHLCLTNFSTLVEHLFFRQFLDRLQDSGLGLSITQWIKTWKHIWKHTYNLCPFWILSVSNSLLEVPWARTKICGIVALPEDLIESKWEHELGEL